MNKIVERLKIEYGNYTLDESYELFDFNSTLKCKAKINRITDKFKPEEKTYVISNEDKQLINSCIESIHKKIKFPKHIEPLEGGSSGYLKIKFRWKRTLSLKLMAGTTRAGKQIEGMPDDVKHLFQTIKDVLVRSQVISSD